MASKVEALVVIHLSSLDSYSDMEHEASGEISHAYGLAARIEQAILHHEGPVFIVDQAWLFIGRQSWPRAGVIDSLGIPDDAYAKTLVETGEYRQQAPKKGGTSRFGEKVSQREIFWIRFDEQDSDWDPFLKDLIRRLKAAGTDQVLLAGLFFEPDLSEGCVTYTYEVLRKVFPTRVDRDLVGCSSDFFGPEDELPGGYTRGER